MKFTEQQLADFKAFVQVQRSGRFNMLDPRAVLATGLSEEAYNFVLVNYEKLDEVVSGGPRP